MGAVWLAPIRCGKAAIAPWVVLFMVSLVVAIAAGIAQPMALPVLAVAFTSAHAWREAGSPDGRLIFGAVLLITIVALGIHKLPGFTNPIVIAGTISQNAPPFTQYANYDKGAAGLFLLAMVCSRSTASEWSTTLKYALPIAAATVLAVLGSAVSMDYVRIDLKFTETAAVFATVNLFFTVVAEEALFRGFIQERFLVMAGSGKPAAVAAILVSAALFGAAHLGGGTTFAALATIAGIGYATAYQVTGRIEAPILVHGALNTIHFTCFTYPYLI